MSLVWNRLALAAVIVLVAWTASYGILMAQAPAPSPAPPVQLAGKTCVSVDDAAKEPNKDVCLSAHVYALVELADGVRFLDVCSPDLPDAQCRFTLISYPDDRDQVGDLRQYRDRDIVLRGVVRATHGRFGIVISHARQFRGGPEKFRPNPKLLKDFNGQSSQMPIRDPNLAPSGRRRGFMNPSEREPLPAAPKK